MLSVTIDLVPVGDESRRRTLAALDIARTSFRANPESYQVWVYEPTGEVVDVFLTGTHYYEDGAVELVRQATSIAEIRRRQGRRLTVYRLQHVLRRKTT